MNFQHSSIIVDALARLKEDRGDEDAWRTLVAESWPWISAAAYRELHGANELVEDVRQSVFVNVCLDANFPGDIANPDRLYGYVVRITRNTCVDYWRKYSRRRETALDEARISHSLVVDTNEQHHLEETREVLAKAVSELSNADKKLVELLMADVPRSEIAAELGQSYSTMSVRLYRLRQKLRKALIDNGLQYGRIPTATT